MLRPPPAAINVLELLPAALPEAWSDGATTAGALAEVLSRKLGLPLPWKTVREAIGSALNARYLETAAAWPCDYSAAAQVALREKKAEPVKPKPGSPGTGETAAPPPRGRFKIAEAELQINELQDLAEVAPELLNLAAGQTPLRFFVQIRLGDGQTAPLPELIEKIDAVLAQVKDDWRVAD
jgi:hypothetical protein